MTRYSDEIFINDRKISIGSPTYFIADIAANFSIDGDNLKGSVEGLVDQAKLLVANVTSDNKPATLLAAALEDVTKLVMDMSVNGTVDQPAIKLKSDAAFVGRRLIL